MERFTNEYALVDDTFDSFISMLTNIQDAVQEKWLEFRKRRSDLELRVSQCSDVVNRQKKVSLDIGGTVFNTTEETLIKEKESFFSAMLRSGQWKPDQETGQYFIDRSPQMFGILLDYLRGGKVRKMCDLTYNEREMLKDDLDFYGISTFPIGLAWDANTAKGDAGSFWFTDSCHTLVVGGPSSLSQRKVQTQRFTDYCYPGGVIEFSLEMTGSGDALGKHPMVFFGDFEISTKHGTASWDNFQHTEPLIQPVDADVRRYRFAIDINSLQLTVTGPANDRKIVNLPQKPECMGLCCSFASNATFRIE
eukprot:TRINITY_DN20389_c0_g1_i1.p1 TRINITY_DN20389_c0_g1~~TRINITY_DN20389_c0_g1_i1.p1  ORF type:complete len:307 (+),score=27.06 TRINITY_DN20389_c0_g1_i1:89-1009(+)